MLAAAGGRRRAAPTSCRACGVRQRARSRPPSSSSSLQASWTRPTASIVAALSVPYWLDSPDRRIPAARRRRVRRRRRGRRRGLRARLRPPARRGGHAGTRARGAPGGQRCERAKRRLRPARAHAAVLVVSLTRRVAADRGGRRALCGARRRRVPARRPPVRRSRGGGRAHARSTRSSRTASTASGSSRLSFPPSFATRFVGGIFDRPAGASHPGRWARRMARTSSRGRSGDRRGDPRRGDRGHPRPHEPRNGERGARRPRDGRLHGRSRSGGRRARPSRRANQVVATAPRRAPLRDDDVGAARAWPTGSRRATTGSSSAAGGTPTWRTEFTAEEASPTPCRRRSKASSPGSSGPDSSDHAPLGGLLGLTPDHLPLVGELPGRPGIWTALGYSGHGNVLALLCGEAVAAALLGRPSRGSAAQSGKVSGRFDCPREELVVDVATRSRRGRAGPRHRRAAGRRPARGGRALDADADVGVARQPRGRSPARRPAASGSRPRRAPRARAGSRPAPRGRRRTSRLRRR